MGDEEAEQLTCEGKGKELAKGSIKGLLVDFAIYLFVSLLRLRMIGIRKEPEEKGESEDLKKKMKRKSI